jgi:hypothetical protein
MFIPRGKVIHERLATSYVLVDALVADLCEGGFTGAIEVRLKEGDGFITILSGKVAAVAETFKEPHQDEFKRGSVSQLAARARLERGAISIHEYSAEIARILADRINAESLYDRLKIEFGNLENMIAKLANEVDREWFIEVNTDDRLRALLHLNGGQCRLIESTGAYVDRPFSADPMINHALRKFLDECKHAGGTFSVSFKPPADAANDFNELDEERGFIASTPPWTDAGNKVSTELATEEQIEMPASQPVLSSPVPDVSPLSKSIDVSERASDDFHAELAQPSLAQPSGELPSTKDDETMWELKRLMGEIARAIEGAAQAVDHHDSFSLALRAGQLKIADQYPFLDPFRNEFEYLDGELVFVGKATAEDFVVGFTEALDLAIAGVSRSTEYGDKFRGYVVEDLRALLARDRSELERFGLDQVIEHILADGERSRATKAASWPLR